jgi:hypothetical protein
MSVRRRCLSTACRLLILAGLAAFPAAAADELGITVRQVIIRAPALRVVAAALQHAEDDDALAKDLLSWVDDGSATLVSEVSGLLREPASTQRLRMGFEFDWVTQCDQEFEKALLRPTATQKVFLGTSLDAQWNGQRTASSQPYVDLQLASSFSPREPAEVNWPVWWPENKEPLVNAYAQKDFFTESVITAAAILVNASVVVGIMRPADHISFEPMRAEKLDVFVVQARLSGQAPSPAGYGRGSLRADPFASNAHPIATPRDVRARYTFFGFGLSDADAVALLSRNHETRDKVLLGQLIKKVDTGDARLRSFTSVTTRSSQRATLQAMREHSYPTEMPTIPSAWSMNPIGDVVQIDPYDRNLLVELEHHPAPPRTGKWPCALDSAELFMILPQFFLRKINTEVFIGDDGVTLLGAMRSPDCNEGGKGLMPGETLVWFVRRDGLPDLRRKPLPEPDKPNLELEAVVFDIPAAEAATWEAQGDARQDALRFAELMERLERGDVKLAAHVAMVRHGVPTGKAQLDAVEKVWTVTEIDPPQQNPPTRFRPTAMQWFPTGTTWEVQFQAVPGVLGETEIELEHKLQHDVAPPSQPTAKEFIATAVKTDGDDVPSVTIFEETWEGTERLKPGSVRFIGARQPPGEKFKPRLHIAFLRSRVTNFPP